MATVLLQHLAVIAGALLALALAEGLGRWVVRPGSLEDRAAETVLSAMFGAMALSAVLGVLLFAARLHTFWAPAAAGTWAALGAAGRLRASFLSRRLPAAPAAPPPASPSSPTRSAAPSWRRLAMSDGMLARCAWAAFGASAILAVAGACAPATALDATYCHFALPAYWVREGAMPDRLDWPFYYYPLNLHMLYAAGMAAGGGTPAAALVDVFCTAAAALLIWRWAAGAGGTPAGAAAALLFFGCVAFGTEADSGNVEPGLMAFGSAAMLLLARARARGDRRLLAWASVATGFTLGIKMTSFPLLIPWAAAAVWPGPLSRRSVAAWGGVALLLGAPWYARAAAATGNPFYPAFSGLFDSPYVNLPREAEVLKAPVPFAVQAIRHGVLWYAGAALAALVGGRLGVLRQTGLPAAAAMLLVTVAGAAATAPWAGFHLPRFVSLVFPPLLVAGGIAWARGLSALPRVFRPGLLLPAAIALAALGGLAARLAFKLPVIVGATERARFLSDRMNTYPLLERLNGMPDAPGRPIRALLTDGRSLYLTREFVYGADHHAYVDYAGLKDGAAFHRRLAELGVTHLVLNRLPTAHTDTLINRNRMDPTFLDPAHFRLLATHRGAPRHRYAPAETEPAELYEFIPTTPR